jgi:hypothetical protein
MKMSKWRTFETDEVVWGDAEAEQARFDKLQTDIKNNKTKLVDGAQELIQGIKRFTEEELRIAEEAKIEKELGIGYALIAEWEARLGRELTDEDTTSEEFIDEYIRRCR